MTRWHRNSFRGVAVFFLLLIFMFSSTRAQAEFNTYSLFGAGSVSTSLGGMSIDSYADQLGYLVNPSLINQFEATRYSLSLSKGDENNKIYSTKYRNIILSYATKRKGYSLIIDQENGWSRDMLTYTTTFPYAKGKYDIGFNLSGFRFSKPVQHTGTGGQIVLPADDGSGVSLDVGLFKEFSDGIRGGISIQNLVGFGSSVAVPRNVAGDDIRLPMIVNLSVAYPLREKILLYAGYKMINNMNITENTNFNLTAGNSMFYLGGELKMQGGKSARLGGMGSNALTNVTDKALLFGGSMEYQNYMASGHVIQKLEPSDYVAGVTVSYKPNEAQPWKGVPAVVATAPELTELEKKDTEEKFEQPLPSTTEEKVETVTEKDKRGKKDVKDSKVVPLVDKERTRVASFEVSPKVIIVPSIARDNVRVARGHWSEEYYGSMAADGFFPYDVPAGYGPNSLVAREEYYRLLFVSQLTGLFSNPISVSFNTPYAVSAELWLDSPSLNSPVLLQEGTYERSGMKRLVVNMALLEENEIFAGKYKIKLKLSAEGMLPEELEDYITVLDTSIDFSAIAASPQDERKKKVDMFKDSMRQLGINVDYLDGLVGDGPITRIEAIRVMIESSLIDLPKSYDRKDIEFSDIWQLDEKDQAVVFMASRGMFSLGGRALMGGYGDGTFKPQKEMLNAEAVVLVDRYRKLTRKDFEAPYRVAVAPEATKSTYVAVPSVDKEQPQQKRIIEVKYLVTAGSYMNTENAKNAVQIVRDNGIEPDYIVERIGSAEVHYVVLGKFENRDVAEKYLASLTPIPQLDFKVTEFSSGDAVAYAPGNIGTGTSSTKPAPSYNKQDAEGTLHLDGESFLPWNLIRNMDEFDPHSAESRTVVVE